jgi:hypothetical protein
LISLAAAGFDEHLEPCRHDLLRVDAAGHDPLDGKADLSPEEAVQLREALD